MPTSVTIGDFSRMTHLTVKTLRHYHRVGLLEPAEIDPRTGYRYYSTDQVAAAQVIRRFRDLDMPIDEVRSVLSAPDRASRNHLIAAHLDRLQGQLDHTRSAVESLRNLLDPPDGDRSIEQRSIPALQALAISANVGHSEVGAWWTSGLAELRASAEQLGMKPVGPAGGLYANELFQDERGDATLYLPVSGPPPSDLPGSGTRSDPLVPGGRVHPMVVPAAELAVLVHQGPEGGIDVTYGALGVYVAEHGLAGAGPVRESYLVDATTTSDAALWRTEVGWPITTDATLGGR